MNRRRRPMSPWARVCAAGCGAVLALLAVPGSGPAHAAAPGRFTQLRTWFPSIVSQSQFDGWYGSTRIVFDPARRVMWVAAGSPSVLAAYDADSLTLRSAPLPLQAAVSSLTLDPSTGGVIAIQPTAQVSNGFGLFDESDLVGEFELQGTTVKPVWQANLASLGANVEVASLTVDDRARAVYIASQIGGPTVGADVTVSRIPLVGASPAVQWSSALPPSCPALPSPEKFGNAALLPPAAMALPADRHAIYVICGSPQFNTARTALPSGIGRLALSGDPSVAPAPGNFSLYPISGNFYDSTGSVFDPMSGRLIVDEDTNESGAEAVFDTGSDRYVGLINGAANHFQGLGFDAVAGRLYMSNQNPVFGLMATDARTTPPSQPTTYPNLYIGGPAMIPVDGATSRLFLLHTPSQGNDGDSHAYYRVMRDDQPPVDVSHLTVDPDSNTSDIAESPGATGATYSTSAQGYGAVVRSIGGPLAAADDTEDVFTIDNGGTNPELRGAYLNATTLSADEATASSIPADRDQNTTAADQASACAAAPAQAQPVVCPWPYTPAACSSFDAAVSQTTSGPQGSATSTCSQQQRSATTQATYAGGDLGAVSVGALSTSSTLLEGTTDGARAEVTSEARDVSLLGGALRIARVATTAIAHAHGRPGTAGTSFTRTVEGVVLDGTSLCSGTCDLDVVAQEVEAAFPGRLRIDFPSPDGGFAKGSPGGYQALVRLSDAEHLDDVLLSDQPADRLEVAGMVVTEMLDTARPSRTVLMLAGVEAEAHYGIYPLDQFNADQAAGLVPGAPSTPQLSSATIQQALAMPLSSSAAGSAAPRSAPVAAAVSPIPALFGWHGWQWALSHPGELLRLAAVWLVFLIPVYLSARRWSLLRRHHLDMELA